MSAGSRRSSSSSLRHSSTCIQPRSVITVPAAENSASRPEAVTAPRRTVTVSPTASIIWLATVRRQISS